VAKYDLIEVPVVDSENRLQGIVTIDDIVDVLEEEATEDMLRLGGVGETEHAFTPTRKSVGRRLPWLGINLITAFLAASVVGLFQDTIKAVVTLAVFMPIVAGMGGNAGTQAVTIIVRSIALGEVTVADTWRLLLKEATVGVLMGLVIGTLAGIAAYLWIGNPVLGIVVGLALIANLLFAGIVGASVPLFFRRLNLDPALASGILLTTVTDLMGFFIFLGLATLLLRFL
jgi:magnesium transporter